MTRKTWMLIAMALLLAGGSLYLNKDWFAKENIHVYDRSRPINASRARTRAAENSLICPIVFGFGQRLRLTSIKVVPLRALETNQFARPVWHLVSDSNSIPTKAFSYGQRIPGMRPASQGAIPAPLQPGEKYRLFVEAGSRKAQHDFMPLPAVQ
jgi:hypothetical protein